MSVDERIAATAARYGCDGCGRPKHEHERRDDRDRLYCPVEGNQWSTWRGSQGWTNDGHRLAVEYRHGFRPVLLCEGASCPELRCHCTGEEGWGDPRPDCADCCGSGEDPSGQCWLQHVLENIDDFEELTPWSQTISLDSPVPILWHGGWDDFEWRPNAAELRRRPTADELVTGHEDESDLVERNGTAASGGAGA